MQMLERAEQLCRIEPAPMHIETTLALKMIKQLSAIDCASHQLKSSTKYRHGPKLMTR